MHRSQFTGLTSGLFSPPLDLIVPTLKNHRHDVITVDLSTSPEF
ncbi:hypothetical protein [Leptothermofonsia sichuanensis]|nr:hypothetical protein [Leptothermofonsia sichuanensis]